MVYYIAGGSVYNASSYKVYAYADHDGYPDVEYGARTDADMGTGDCYWRLGGTGGQQVAEIGLNDSYRIRISSSGIEGYSEDATGWVDLLAGGGGGASQLSDLTDVNLVSYTDGFVLRADGVDFEAGYLQWGDIDSKPSSFTPSSHALPVSGGYHSGELALIDLGSYVRGSLIRGGATDWEALAKGTENYVLKAGATDINWGQVDWGELTGKPSSFTPIQHGIANNTYHSSSATVGQMLKADANGLPVNATNTDAQVSATVTASHARSHAITGSSDHTMTANRILYSSNTAVITELALGSANYYLKSQGATSVPIFAQIQHGELGGVGTSDHHVKYTDGEVDARIALANHDTLLNPNGNADEQHLTAAQVTALHATYTDGEAVQAVEDTGLVMTATKVITTGDESTAFSFGKNALGIDAQPFAFFGYRGMNTSNYALKQDEDFETILNAADSKNIWFRINNTTRMMMDVDGLVLSASTALEMDGTPANTSYTGIVLDIDTTGCTVGQAVYVDGTNSVLPADADAITTMPCIGICVAAGKVLTHGVYRNDAVLALATASKVYVSTTAGDLTTTAPSGSGDIVQVVGITVGADMIFVNPSLDWVEVV